MIKSLTRTKIPNSARAPLAFLLFVMTMNIAFAQTRQITGKITDESNEGLPGASVIIKGSASGSVTDLDGKFTLSASSDDVLIISFVGYASQEIAIGNKSVIDVSLELDSKQLAEVVVVGYGTQKRAEVTGAIASVSADKITAVPVATLDQALQGRAAGVNVINNGSPGTAPTVQIRGLGTVNNNAPLYVVDGVIASSITGLSPNDIESMEVLKDASTAAVYGAKGANGVIMITTKSGQSGKVKIDVSSYAGTQWSTDRYDLLNTQQYEQYAREAFLFDDDYAVPGRFSDPSWSSLQNNDTDWQDEIYQSGIIQNHNVAISGGGENATFRISGGYFAQDGIMKNTGYERYNFRANSNYTFGKLKIGEQLSLAFSEQNPEPNSGGRSVLEHAIKMAPYFPVRNADNVGGFQGPNNDLDGQDAENPVRILELNSLELLSTNIIGNIFAEYEIIEGLKFKTQVGVEYTTSNYTGLNPSYDDDNIGSTGSQNFANINKQSSSLQTVLLTNSLYYNKTFNNKHNLGLLVLAEKTSTDTKFTNSGSQNLLSDLIPQVGNDQPNLRSESYEYIRIGYLARLNYNYDGKYIFAASIRRDGSSRFGDNNRWGTFHSLSAGWRISQENFLKNSSVVSNLKLRGSWGVTGNDLIPDYGYLNVVNDNFIYPFPGYMVGAVPQGLANPDLKWEESTMTNIGLDAGLLDDRITFSAEYFSNELQDMLLPVRTPISSGFDNSAVFRNTGSMETKGLEFNLGYNDFTGDFQWSAEVNLSTTKNKVISLGGNQAISGASFENQDISRIAPGFAAFQFYGWQFDGIFQTQAEVDGYKGGSQAENLNAAPGDFRIVDTNNDGVINADDRTYIGNALPDVTYGLNLSASYKNVDFSVFFQGMAGNDIYNTNIYDLEAMPRLFNSGVAVLDRWTEAGSSNTIPRAGGAAANSQISSRFVEDGSFARLRNLTIGYSLPSAILKDKIDRVRFYITGQNLLTITDYSGLNPEVGAYTVVQPNGHPQPVGTVATTGSGQPVGNFTSGIDFGNYPNAKSFIIGVDLSF